MYVPSAPEIEACTLAETNLPFSLGRAIAYANSICPPTTFGPKDLLIQSLVSLVTPSGTSYSSLQETNRKEAKHMTDNILKFLKYIITTILWLLNGNQNSICFTNLSVT